LPFPLPLHSVALSYFMTHFMNAKRIIRLCETLICSKQLKPVCRGGDYLQM